MALCKFLESSLSSQRGLADLNGFFRGLLFLRFGYVRTCSNRLGLNGRLSCDRYRHMIDHPWSSFGILTLQFPYCPRTGSNETESCSLAMQHGLRLCLYRNSGKKPLDQFSVNAKRQVGETPPQPTHPFTTTDLEEDFKGKLFPRESRVPSNETVT